MANQKTHIVKRGETFCVLPPMADLRPGNRWKIVNHTSETCVLTLPARLVGGGEKPAAIKQEIAGKPLRLKIHKHAPAGVYEYQITMLRSGKKAKGNSDPMVIIDI